LNGHIHDASGLAAYKVVKLPAVTVDSLSARFGPPDVVFVDVEGHEFDVLQGAVETFGSRPDWFVAVHCGAGFGSAINERARDVVARFRELGYQLFIAPREGAPFAVATGQVPSERFFLVALAKPPSALPLG
jgi:hypothetical protein